MNRTDEALDVEFGHQNRARYAGDTRMRALERWAAVRPYVYVPWPSQFGLLVVRRSQVYPALPWERGQ